MPLLDSLRHGSKCFLLSMLIYIEVMILKGMILSLDNYEKDKLNISSSNYSLDSCSIFRSIQLAKLMSIGITFIFYDFANYYIFKFSARSRRLKIIIIVGLSLLFAMMIILMITSFSTHVASICIGVL